MEEATRKVNLRSETFTGGARFLDARILSNGDLEFAGQDLGRGTPDGDEYEWFTTLDRGALPDLLELLDEDRDTDVLEVLGKWTGPKSYDLERLLRESDIPRRTFVI